MVLKRSSTEAGLQPILATRPKRSRDERSGDSSTSSSSEASVSALESSPVASAETAATSTSSVASNEDTSDSSSSSSEDEEESDSDSDTVDQGQEEPTGQQQQPPETITLGQPNQKPSMNPERVQSYANELQARLEEFMPRLRQANSELEANGSNVNMEQVADDEQHIEMNLGLGVLEQKDKLANESEDVVTRPRADASDDSDDDVAGESDSGLDVMSRLLNVPKTKDKASIQEIPIAETR